MNTVTQKVHEFADMVRRAVPGPKEITHDIAHEMEHAAEFLDPQQADVRFVTPEPVQLETTEEPAPPARTGQRAETHPPYEAPRQHL